MPLHDWNELEEWETVHASWIVELGRWLKQRLPPGYRMSLATVGSLVVAPRPVHPDVSVRQNKESTAPESDSAGSTSAVDDTAPDEEVAIATLDPVQAVHVTRAGNLVAVIELISPGNKDRPETRRTATDRFIGYLAHGVHLLIVDVHRRPLQFSFPDDLAEALVFTSRPLPAPYAVSYRMGGPALEAGTGSLLAWWKRPLEVGSPLPLMRLPLSRDITIPVDLEQTYMHAAADAYLS
jgi:hypothetical protein